MVRARKENVGASITLEEIKKDSELINVLIFNLLFEMKKKIIFPCHAGKFGRAFQCVQLLFGHETEKPRKSLKNRFITFEQTTLGSDQKCSKMKHFTVITFYPPPFISLRLRIKSNLLMQLKLFL